MNQKHPEYQDLVKNDISDVVGRVIAKYKINDVVYLDVRGEEDRIYYKTPAKNWSVMMTREELE